MTFRVNPDNSFNPNLRGYGSAKSIGDFRKEKGAGKAQEYLAQAIGEAAQFLGGQIGTLVNYLKAKAEQGQQVDSQVKTAAVPAASSGQNADSANEGFAVPASSTGAQINYSHEELPIPVINKAKG